MSTPRVVFFGYHSIGARCLAALISSGTQVCAVVTHQDSPDESVWFESVAGLARHNNLPVYAPVSPNTVELVRVLRSLEPDLLISVYYRQLLCPEILALPTVAAVNLHGSLLPKYRGRAPVNWALVNGERETGVTLHHMIAEADAGDIIAQAAVPIGPDDTALVVYRRMIEAAEKVLIDMIPLLVSGAAPRRPQDHRAATVFGRRRPEDGRIEWGWPASRIHNLVRAVTHPYPGAFTTWMGKRLFVWETRLGPPHLDPLPLPGRLCHKSVHGSTGSPRTDRETQKFNHLAVRPELVEGRTADCDAVSGGGGEGGGRTSKARWDITDAVTNSRVPAIPGTILDAQGEDIAVQTGDGCLLIRSLQMEGQREISGAAFLKQGGAQLGGILGK